MKYCTRCGKELHDEAVMCTGCGCMIAPVFQSTEEKAISTPKESNFSLIYVFNFIYAILVAFSLLFLLTALFDGYIHSDVTFYDSNSYSHFSRFILNYDFIAASFIFSLVGVGFSLASVIIAAVKRAKLKTVLTCISELIIAALIMLFSASYL